MMIQDKPSWRVKKLFRKFRSPPAQLGPCALTSLRYYGT
jgi:hypothetical protein